MNVDLIIKIAGIGLIAAISEQLLDKAGKGEYAILITIVGIIIVLMVIVPEISGLFDLLRETFEV